MDAWMSTQACGSTLNHLDADFGRACHVGRQHVSTHLVKVWDAHAQGRKQNNGTCFCLEQMWFLRLLLVLLTTSTPVEER